MSMFGCFLVVEFVIEIPDFASDCITVLLGILADDIIEGARITN